MSSQKIKNTFEGGMNQDIDPKLKNPNTYRLSVNMRLIFNEDGSFSLENIKGNVSSSDLPQKVVIVGRSEYTDFTLLYTKRNIGFQLEIDEIGVLTYTDTGYAQYQLLFSDEQLQSKLNFSLSKPIQSCPFHENDSLIRDYFTDDLNEPRVFTFKRDSSNLFSTITTSVFSMNKTPNWKIGQLDYKGICEGVLTIGIYQYTYRLKTEDGYTTPWAPISFPIPITGSKPIDNNERYGMKVANTPGVLGNIIEVSSLDTNYFEIEIAYIYSIVASTFLEAGIFFAEELKGRTDINTAHKSNDGVIAINISEFTEVKEVISKAKTIQIKNNRLWLGNTEGSNLFDIPDSVLDNFYVEPVFKALNSDRNSDRLKYDMRNSKGFCTTTPGIGGEKMFKSRYEKFGKADTYAISTHEITKWGIQGVNPIVDYHNYQGAQVCHSFTGYFRGETYRFGILFYDKKGQPSFVKHFADVKLPSFTKGLHDPSLGNKSDFKAYKNELIATRVKDDGTTQVKTVEIGNMGGIPTETNDNYSSNVNVDANTGDRRLYGKTLQRSASAIQDVHLQYHRSENSPIDSNHIFKPTRTVFNNPNNSSSAEDNTLNHEPGSRSSYCRILGLKFGGIDLSIQINGVPLYELIGGVEIVRVERTGANEQVKDSGIILNCLTAGTSGSSENSVQKSIVWNNPLIGGAIPYGTGAGYEAYGFYSRSLDGGLITDNGTAIKPFLEDGVFSIDAVGRRVTGIPFTLNLGSGKIRPEYICDISNPKIDYHVTEGLIQSWQRYQSLIQWKNPRNKYTGAGDDFSKADIQLPRHYLSKNLNTYNTNSLISGGASGNDFMYESCNQLFDIDRFGDAALAGGNYGTFKGKSVGLELYMADNSTSTFESSFFGLQLNHNSFNGSKADRWYRSRASSTIILESKLKYQNAKGQITGPIEGGNDKLSFYVASIVEPNDSPYGGSTSESLQGDVYISCGQFLSISQGVIDDIQAGGYILNEVEVWGGDCYLDMFSYLRVNPLIEYIDNGGNIKSEPRRNGNDSTFRDWAHGIVYPVQSKYNFRMTLKDDSNGVPTWAGLGTSNGNSILNNLFDDNDHDEFYPWATNLIRLSDSGFNEKAENYAYSDVLDYKDRTKAFSAKPFNFVNVFNFPNRWHWSDEKITYNAKKDVFRDFRAISNIDISGVYGEITGNSLLGNNMYSIQERSFVRMRIFDRAAVQTSDIGTLLLGEGGVMDGVDYISKTYGSQHRDSIKASDRNIYFIDARMRKLFRFGQDGLNSISDQKGIHSFIAPYLNRLDEKNTSILNGKGIITGFDYSNNDVLFTIKDGINKNINSWYWDETEGGLQVNNAPITAMQGQLSFDSYGNASLPKYIDAEKSPGALTIVYNEKIAIFQGIHTYFPTIYWNNGNDLYSSGNNGKGIYQYNKGLRSNFFGDRYFFGVVFDVAKFPSNVKIFDNSHWSINSESLVDINAVILTAESSKHELIDFDQSIVDVVGYKNDNLGNNARARYRNGILHFPTREAKTILQRSQGVLTKPRLSGKSMLMEIWCKPRRIEDPVNRFSLTSIETSFRIQNRK